MTSLLEQWRWHRLVEAGFVVLLAALALGYGLSGVGIGSGYVDPVSQGGAQDESVYGHSALRMARGEGWLTPVFLDRFVLYKPPLLMWAGAGSLRLFGISPFALRLPAVLGGLTVCVLVFLWARRSHRLLVSLAAVLLLASNGIFHLLSRRFMTDAMLTMCLVVVVYLVDRDPRLSRPATVWGVGLFSGAAIMAKAIAGLLPLIVVVFYWAVASRTLRPRSSSLFLAFGVAGLVALPWHLYQLTVHREWFLAEYVGMLLVQSRTVTPEHYSVASQLWFYLRRMALIDPVLCLLLLTGLPGFVAQIRRPDQVFSRLLLSWLIVVGAALVVFRYQVAYYLLPAIPALCLVAVFWSPLFKRRKAIVTFAVLVIAFVAKAAGGGAAWALDFDRGTTVKSAAPLKRYCQQQRNNELVIVSADDEFYSAILDLPKVRYCHFASAIDPAKVSSYMYDLGLILTAEQFKELPKWEQICGRRLRAWGLADDAPVGTLIVVDSTEELMDLIRSSPQRDFFLPERYRQELTSAGELADHQPTSSEAGRFFLLSKTSSRRDVPCGPGSF